MPGALHFVNVVPGKLGADGKTSQKALRSHVMKDFRRRQRQEAVQRHAKTTSILCDDPSEKPTIDIDRQQSTDKVACSTNDVHHESEALREETWIHERDSTDGSLVRLDSSIYPAEQLLGTEAQLHDQSHEETGYMQPGHTVALPQLLRSLSVFRAALLQAFIQGTFTTRDWSCPSLVAGFGPWLKEKPQMLEYVNDAVGLLQLGDMNHDKRLTTEGQRRHIMAVQSLRGELYKPGVSLQVVSITAINIFLSGLYSATSSGLPGCVSHVAGLTAILQAHIRRPNAEPLSPIVTKHYHRLTLMHALINRKALSVSRKIVDIHGYTVPGSVEALMQIASHLTGFLSAVSLRNNRAAKKIHLTDAAPLEIRRTGHALARDFDAWLQSYEQISSRNRSHSLEFHSFLDANILGLYWSCRLLLAESLYKLHIATPPTGGLNPEASQRYRDEADIYATNLFDTALAIETYEGSALSKGFATRAPLHFAREWWQMSGDEVRLQTVLDFESTLRLAFNSIDWDTLLYWSFVPILWLV